MAYEKPGNRIDTERKKADNKKTPKKTPTNKKLRGQALLVAATIIVLIGTSVIANNLNDAKAAAIDSNLSYNDLNYQYDENGDLFVDQYGNEIFFINPSISEDNNYHNWLDYENMWREVYGEAKLEDNTDSFSIFRNRTKDGSTTPMLADNGRKMAGGKI